MSSFKQTEFNLSVMTLVSVTLLSEFTKVPVFVQLFLNAIFTVYLGQRNFSGQQTPEDKEEDLNAEKVTSKDAYMFPVYGSCVLLSFYLLFKFFDKNLLGVLISIYFSFLGHLCLMQVFDQIISQTTYKSLKKQYVFSKQVDINLGPLKYNGLVQVSMLDVITFIIALPFTGFYVTTKHWVLNNLFGIAFSVTGIQAIELPNFKVGFILLWGLFFYDIFWVYGTDVMVTVAKSLDAPIKLQFPIDQLATPPKFSMLGLGDIVIPGIFVALALKYDVDRHLASKGTITDISTPYFNCCFLGYVTGIVATFAAMTIFNHAQPALLFLVPGCCGAVLILAMVKGELKQLFQYEESPEKLEEIKEQKDK